MSNTNEIYAKNLMKRADARMKPSLMRWKPDLRRGNSNSTKTPPARTERRITSKWRAKAEEKSADGDRYDLMITGTRVNHWKRATELLTKCEPLDGGAVLQMAERANEAYVMANRAQAGAESLSRAGEIVRNE
jgi:hypothetical protein